MKKTKWKAHVEACEKSGNNKRAYAEEHDLTCSQLLYWSRTLEEEPSGVPKYAGYSLHTSVSCKTKQRRKLERLCRYVARSALSDQRLSNQRLSLSSTGKVIYSLKTPYSDGTTHVVLNPLDFISRLASLVPPPWQNLTSYYGAFATASKYRAQVMLNPSKPDKTNQKEKPCQLHKE